MKNAALLILGEGTGAGGLGGALLEIKTYKLQPAVRVYCSSFFGNFNSKYMCVQNPILGIQNNNRGSRSPCLFTRLVTLDQILLLALSGVAAA